MLAVQANVSYQGTILLVLATEVINTVTNNHGLSISVRLTSLTQDESPGLDSR